MQVFGRIGRVSESGGPSGQMGKFFKIEMESHGTNRKMAIIC